MLTCVCCDLLSINTVLHYTKLYVFVILACGILKITNNINVNFYDNKWVVPGLYNAVNYIRRPWGMRNQHI